MAITPALSWHLSVNLYFYLFFLHFRYAEILHWGPNSWVLLGSCVP